MRQELPRLGDALGRLEEALAGRVLAETEVEPTDGRATLTTEVVAPSDADALLVRLDGDDALPGDDARPVLLDAAGGPTVLLVDGDAAGAAGRGEVAYLSRALEVRPAEGGPLRVRTVDADALDAGTLEDVDVVFMANVGAPSAIAARALRDHHAAGGGLVLSVGDRVDSRAWRARLGDLLPASLGGELAGPRDLAPERTGVGAVDGLTAVHASRILSADPVAGSETLARWSDGSPALVVGERVALWTSTFDEAWSDVPLHPGFVALTHRLARELSGHAHGPAAVAPGDSLSLPAGTRVEDPAGERWAAETFDRTTQPGVYRILDEGDAVVGRFVIAPPAAESDLAAGSVPEAGEREGGRGATHRAPFGVWLYLLFGLVVLGEGALRARRRT